MLPDAGGEPIIKIGPLLPPYPERFDNIFDNPNERYNQFYRTQAQISFTIPSSARGKWSIAYGPGPTSQQDFPDLAFGFSVNHFVQLPDMRYDQSNGWWQLAAAPTLGGITSFEATMDILIDDEYADMQMVEEFYRNSLSWYYCYEPFDNKCNRHVDGCHAGHECTESYMDSYAMGGEVSKDGFGRPLFDQWMYPTFNPQSEICMGLRIGYQYWKNQDYAAQCIDIDECQQGSPCGPGLFCVNTPGSYECKPVMTCTCDGQMSQNGECQGQQTRECACPEKFDISYISGEPECIPIQCNCPANGVSSEGQNCPIEGAPDCASCDEGYYMFQPLLYHKGLK